MWVTLSGIVIDLRDVQYSNAFSPIHVTESGIDMDCSDIHDEKVPLSIKYVIEESGTHMDRSEVIFFVLLGKVLDCKEKETES